MMNIALVELIKTARAYKLNIEPHILERGLRYWEQGVLSEVQRLSCGGLIAVAHGSRDYDVILELLGRGRGVELRGSCDCPYRGTCKHVGALFVEFLYRESTDGQDSAVDQCLEALAALAAPVSANMGYASLQLRMLRRVSMLAGGKHFVSLEMIPYILRTGKNGKPLKPRLARTHYGHLEDDGLHPNHRSVLQWLVNMRPQFSQQRETAVPEIAVGKFLGLALQEEMLVDVYGEKPIARGERRLFTMTWQEHDGKHQLAWRLEGDALSDRLQLIRAAEAFWYIDLDAGLMGEVECAFSPDNVARVGRLPTLDSTQRERVEADIVEKFRAPEVLALSRANEAPQKSVPMCGKLLRIDAASDTLEPSWLYEGGVEVKANPDCDRSYLGEQQFWLLRDVAAESAALIELGDITGVINARLDRRGDLTLNPGLAFNWPHFSLEVVPHLEACGWQVELPDSYRYIRNDVFELSVDMDEGDAGGWWFEVGFSIECDGRKLPLVPILSDWIARYGLGEGPLQGLMDDELFQLKVDSDSHVWRAPVKLLRTLINQFADLLDAADGNQLKLPSAVLGHMSEALADMPTLPWQAPAKFLALEKSLTAARAPKPMSPPEGFTAELRPYQEAGVGWLQFLADTGMNGVLADDMGLGKTVQTLAHICHMRHAKPDAAPVLVVAPTSVVGNWKRETARFAPEIKQLILYGPSRQQWFDRLGEFDLVLTSYALLQRDTEVLAAQPFSLVVLDEGQWIKNPRAKTTVAAKALNTERRLCLSGTPMENHTGELWSLFDFLMPGFLGSEKRFRDLFRNPIEKQADSLAMARLQRRTAPFVLRRSKQLVAADLPERNEMVQSVDMGSAQKAIYEAVRAQMEKKVRTALEARGLGRSHIMVLEALLKLRQCCCDPRLLPGRTKGRDKAKSAKLELLLELLPTMVEEGRRVLLFSQFTTMLDLIAAELDKVAIDYLKLTGRSRNRDSLVERFQTGEVPVFLISLKAGGVGLNLTAADTVIIYDPWWNPAVEQQAIDRAHRIGQDKPVFVYRLIAEGSIEEKILQLQEHKRLLVSGVLDKSNSVPAGLSQEQILDLLRPI